MGEEVLTMTNFKFTSKDFKWLLHGKEPIAADDIKQLVIDCNAKLNNSKKLLVDLRKRCNEDYRRHRWEDGECIRCHKKDPLRN